MKRLLFLSLVLLLAAALAGAATRARYRIQLRDGSQVLATDLPVQRGTVVTFHKAPGGLLTGLPAEEIVAIQAGSSKISSRLEAADAVVRGRMTAIETLARPLQPGDVVVLGPTGEGSVPTGYGAAQPAPSAASPYTPPPSSAYGGGRYPSVPAGMTPNGQVVFAPQPGNPGAGSGAPPTVGPDGFPVTSGNPPMIGPNGTPVLTPAGAPGAAPPVIGPNGTPVLAPPGTPGSVPPAIAPNGTPASPPPKR
jgi:hypothetical protein